MTEDMPNCDELLQLCTFAIFFFSLRSNKYLSDAMLARQYGDTVLEELLFCELLQVYRDPQLLIERTKEK